MTESYFSIETVGSASIPSILEYAEDIRFVEDSTRIAANPELSAIEACIAAGNKPDGFEIAGPRAKLRFDPKSVRAAIVTCGGLCPGINAVIRGLVHQLWHRYGCEDVLGIRHGYGGLGEGGDEPMQLTPEIVANIHTLGGTILGSSRGTPATEEIVDSLVARGINMLFTIGGDGTMRGANALWEEIKRRNLEIAVVGVPKTIDNDIPYVRRSFGFETAMAVATQTVHAAHTEALGAPYGIGLVKLMGRHSGYIAANACLASGHANFCLVPEIPFELDGSNGLFNLLEKRLRERRHAVIVVAEGAGQEFFEGEAVERDASGNVKLVNIGLHLRDRINEYFANRDINLSLKYIDPSYLIRAAPANPTDQLFCARLAQDAVHAGMAGKSGLLIGYWHGRLTHVPMRVLGGERQSIRPQGELWFNVMESTGQPRNIR